MARAGDPVVVTGVGLATSLGGAVQTAAAVRAGLARPKPLADVTVFDEDLGENTEPMGFPAAGVTDGFVGLGRLVRLALAAWRDLAWRGGTSPPARTSLLLGIPDPYYLAQVAASLKEQADAVREDQRDLGGGLAAALVKHAGLPAGIALPNGFYEGASMAQALADAARLLAAGEAELVLVGGVDSLTDPARVEAVHALHLLHTAETPTGFMPGEAAAFLALESRRGAERRRAPILATLSKPWVLRDVTHRLSPNPPDGRALWQVVERALGTSERTPGRVMGSLNGDEWKAREWGATVTRLPRTIKELRLVLPALSLGEIGTAFPLVTAVLALRAIERRYAGDGSVLVWASGDDGAKVSFVIGPPPAA